MAIAVGLDFGSLGIRTAYMQNEQLLVVPVPLDIELERNLLTREPIAGSSSMVAFSSLKYKLATNQMLQWRGSSYSLEDELDIILTRVCRQIETFAGDSIRRTLIAVPALYTTARREIVRRSARQAGFGEVELVNDGTAATLSYLSDAPGGSQTLLTFSCLLYTSDAADE